MQCTFQFLHILLYITPRCPVFHTSCSSFCLYFHQHKLCVTTRNLIWGHSFHIKSQQLTWPHCTSVKCSKPRVLCAADKYKIKIQNTSAISGQRKVISHTFHYLQRPNKTTQFSYTRNSQPTVVPGLFTWHGMIFLQNSCSCNNEIFSDIDIPDQTNILIFCVAQSGSKHHSWTKLCYDNNFCLNDVAFKQLL
jgi:hypothetical protein